MTTTSQFMSDMYQLENKTPSNIDVYISVWICKNMATEISLIYPLTESCSGAFFLYSYFKANFYSFNRYRKSHSRQTLMNFSLAISLLPPPSPPQIFFSELPIILSVCQFKISVRIRLNSALILSCPFLAALTKIFRKASIRLMKEQFSRLAKSAASNIFWYFVSFWTTRVKD